MDNKEITDNKENAVNTENRITPFDDEKLEQVSGAGERLSPVTGVNDDDCKIIEKHFW